MTATPKPPPTPPNALLIAPPLPHPTAPPTPHPSPCLHPTKTIRRLAVLTVTLTLLAPLHPLQAANLTLPSPIYFEDFDATPEGQLPPGWTATHFTEVLNPSHDLNNLDSAAYAGWTTVDATRFRGPLLQHSNPAQNSPVYQRVLSFNPANIVNGLIVTNLAQGRLLFANSGYRQGRSQVQYLFTPDFDLSRHTNVHLAFHGLYEQNQDSLGAVEFSTNRGATWEPIAYWLAPEDILQANGQVDADATFRTPYPDVATYVDPQSGQIRGGYYGAFLGVHSNRWPTLGPYVSARKDDDPVDAKRVELFHLPDAHHQPAVRFRFAHAGTDSWYFGLDRFGLYSIPPSNLPQLAALPRHQRLIEGTPATFQVQVQGPGPFRYQWQHNGANLPDATQPVLTIPSLQPHHAGTYAVTVHNDAGAASSPVGSLSVLTSRTHVGPQPGGEHVVPTLQWLRPFGDTLQYGGRPIDLALAPNGRFLYVKDNKGVVAVDASSWTLRQQLPFGDTGGSMHGLALSPDGTRLYATTAANHLAEASVADDGTLAWSRRLTLPNASIGGAPFPCGVALSPDGALAYVCLSRNNSLAIVNLQSGLVLRQIETGIAPFDVVLSPDGSRAYVSDWGGRPPEAHERKAKSAGTDVLVDPRGVAASGTVSFLDLRRPARTATVRVGLHPSGLALSPDGATLYCANANSDTVSVIDTSSATVRETINVRPDPALPYGSAANALALTPDGRHLLVANGGNNALAVVALASPPQPASTVLGFLPTDWYPGAVATDGQRVFVANVKGLGSRGQPPNTTARSVYSFLGTLTRFNLPSPETLRELTPQTKQDARIPHMLRAWEQARSGQPPRPVPHRTGEPSVFQHVFYVIKENRTYDQLFGDLPQGNGDPDLCIFGRHVTPNHHALAEQFVLLDNFYCNGVNSSDGHAWATEGHVADYLEKTFGGTARGYTWGDDPLSYSSTGFIWDNVLLHGLSFRNYGEMDYAETVPAGLPWLAVYRDFIRGANTIRFTQNIGIEPLRRFSPPHFPGWNMRIPDVLRADRFIQDLRQAETNGFWPHFTILYLPNDHTTGTSPGAPTPRAQVADNDLALGRALEALSHSRFWSNSVVFVIEDDPQDGFDHVDGHRSICLVVSPYTKRQTVISEFYNQTAVLHTMERILGLPPMNQMDAQSPLMTACFTNTPNFTPYSALPNNVPLDEMNPGTSTLRGRPRYWARQSLRQNFAQFDRADEDTLNRILWHSVKGADAPYPAAFAGAHGRGLRALGLQLDPSPMPDHD